MAARKLFHPPSILPLAGLFVLTLGLTLLGTLTRPIESLSLFWPINAILLGLLLRQASLATPPGWLEGVTTRDGGDGAAAVKAKL